ncbi:uncharacterized protein EI97DRAFT_454042 [Westerdykella ornata]|uniref:Uncharacterized protein n=1 Tax=Westerdykella ornata TaxID=318751 RepID=A0A6A6JY81_WESOR|nr:uncharacterized protein EI97DRAFT_454042 [Westerdykella ornata]KAF2280798.1 hypothetical protein EI97DRAFT_454042 [Westerdykella ornata]
MDSAAEGQRNPSGTAPEPTAQFTSNQINYPAEMPTSTTSGFVRASSASRDEPNKTIDIMPSESSYAP